RLNREVRRRQGCHPRASEVGETRRALSCRASIREPGPEEELQSVAHRGERSPRLTSHRYQVVPTRGAQVFLSNAKRPLMPMRFAPSTTPRCSTGTLLCASAAMPSAAAAFVALLVACKSVSAAVIALANASGSGCLTK